MNLKPILGGILASAIAASAWTIDGTVTNKMGEPLAGVNITSFNYGGITSTSDATGKFRLSNEDDMTISDITAQGKLSVKRDGFMLNIANPSGGSFKVSFMDALGKLQMQKEFNSQNASIDLKKLAGQKLMILRVSSSNANENYILSRGALMKAGDPMAMLQFALSGYTNLVYNMQAEVETGVSIVMEKASEAPIPSSSSSVVPDIQSSSSVAPILNSSSSVEQFVVNCAGKTATAGDKTMYVNVDGKNREFIMHVPDTYKGDKAVPLVLDFHGIGGSGDQHINATKLKAVTDLEGVISLYPTGTPKNIMGNGWNVGPCCSYDDDIKFSREMIKAVQEAACIDPKRVYATGFSMGGGMTNHIACNMADVIAAVAPAAMDLNTVNSVSCNPARPIPIIMFRGKNDNVCRYGGGDSGYNDGLNFLGAEKNFEFWSKKNGCTDAVKVTNEGSITIKEHSQCMGNVKVILRTNNYGSHDYADGNVAWNFLKQYTLP